MQRNPKKVKKLIRSKDGFVCAYPGCNSPFLEYHHFDPPWNVENHNNPDGIIALCPTHHGHADGGMFSKEELKEWKEKMKLIKSSEIGSRLPWIKNKIGVILGGNLCVHNKYELMINNSPVIWFNKIHDYSYLNINLTDENGNTLIKMEDNDWEVKNELILDLECSPYGKEINISFKNGDFLNLRFVSYEHEEKFISSYKAFSHGLQEFFPLSIVEINANLFNGSIKLKNEMKIDNSKLKGVVSAYNTCGISINN